MKYIYLYFLVVFLGYQSNLVAQYISRSEPVPYSCPSVCASGTLILKIPQIENLAPGTIQAHLSNAAGNFGAGATILEATRYSINQGTTWINGPYNFTGNIQNLFIEITVPLATVPGNQYTIRIRSSNGFQSNDLFQCDGNNFITVTPFVAALPAIPANTFGLNQWFAHTYTWTPTTGVLLTTPALVAQQDFFNASNYKGHLIRNALNFDIVFNAQGWVPGNWHDGTSLGCGNNYTNNFSMRWLRRENFASGLYRIDIAGDDGIRISIDGGNTWLLNSFIEQTYQSSFKTTNTNNPNGICLSGETDLVVEYFQRPADARITLTITQLSTLQINAPADQIVCAGQTANFSVGASVAGLSYQWQLSVDGGNSYTNIPEIPPYSNVTSPNLTVSPVAANMNGYIFRCQVSGTCSTPLNSSTALLTVQALPQITLQPSDVSACDQSATFTIAATGANNVYQWQVSLDNGVTFSNLNNNAPYSGVNTNNLTINPASAALAGNLYRCVVTGCNVPINSEDAILLPGNQITINTQPVNLSLCAGEIANFATSIDGNGTFQWQVSTDNGISFNNLNNSVNISGANTNVLTLDPIDVSQSGYIFRCLISGDCAGDVFTQQVNLQIIEGLQILSQPQILTICPGEIAIFSFETNSYASDYQWYVSSNGIDFNPFNLQAGVSGVQTDSLIINTFIFNVTGLTFYCIATGNCPQGVTSNIVSINIVEAPEILLQPVNATACVGDQVQFQISMSNNGANYQWQNAPDGVSFVNLQDGASISGSNSSVLSISNVDASWNGYVFRVLIDACANEISSQTATLLLDFPPEITLQPSNTEICDGETVLFNISAINAIDFQWQYNDGNGYIDFQNNDGINGANSNQLSISSLNVSINPVQIRCVVNGVCEPDAISNIATLIINTPPVIITQPEDQNICSGTETSVFVQASGLGTQYQWQQFVAGQGFVDLNNNEVFMGANASSLAISNISSDLDGLEIRVVLSGCGQNINSNTVKINVQENKPVFVPNAFTPNGDQINPTFKIYTDGNPQLLMQIFNRWGELIYSFSKIEDAWDGTYKGQLVEAGVYAYKLRIQTACDAYTRLGSIMVLGD